MGKTMTEKQIPLEQLSESDGSTLLNELLSSGIKAREPQAVDHGAALIENLICELPEPTETVSKNLTRAVNDRIAAIDKLLSDQLNEVIHSESFQQLEGSWRGLHSLVNETETSETMKIRVMNCSKKELLRDFQAASEFTESTLWKKVYEYEFGLYGGDPYGVLLGDFNFSRQPQDIELLEHVSKIAAAAHAPFISSAGPGMFGMDSFTQMPDPRDIAKIFDKNNPENTKWLSFRDSEESRFVALCLPRVLARLPYGQDTNPVDAFLFDEDAEDHENYLWSNAAYSFAGRLTEAFASHHWCVAIRGPEGGGLVEGLPVHTFRSREGDVGAKCPSEVLIPDTREKELSDLGFIPLIHCKNTDYAAFFAVNSAQRPKKYDVPEATANARLSSQVQYLMATSRIAHYLKAICRDKVGSFMSRQECQDFLTRWVNNYVLLQDQATQEQKAQKPLREAQIEVVEDRARPGCYKAVAHLKPHFQLDEVNVSLRLVADLPSAAR